MSQLQDCARHYGLEAFILEGSSGLLVAQTALGRPAIIVIKEPNSENHSIVVASLRSHDGRLWARVMDPRDGLVSWRDWEMIEPYWTELGSPMLLVGTRSQDES